MLVFFARIVSQLEWLYECQSKVMFAFCFDSWWSHIWIRPNAFCQKRCRSFPNKWSLRGRDEMRISLWFGVHNGIEQLRNLFMLFRWFVFGLMFNWFECCGEHFVYVYACICVCKFQSTYSVTISIMNVGIVFPLDLNFYAHFL